jgi:hypothetical protein
MTLTAMRRDSPTAARRRYPMHTSQAILTLMSYDFGSKAKFAECLANLQRDNAMEPDVIVAGIGLITRGYQVGVPVNDARSAGRSILEAYVRRPAIDATADMEARFALANDYSQTGQRADELRTLTAARQPPIGSQAYAFTLYARLKALLGSLTTK